MQARKQTRKNSNEFETIYLKADAENRRGLETEISAHACIDVKDQLGLFTPAAKLAAQGRHDSVALLLELGASESQVAMGYASVGNTEKAEAIRKSHPVNLKLLSIGAAMHRDTAYAEKLRKTYDLNPAWFVFGAAYAGNFKYAALLMNSLIPSETAIVKKQHETAACMYIKGLVLGGHMEQAVEFLDAHKNQFSNLYLKEAIEAAGRANLLFHVGVSEKSDDDFSAFLFRSGRQPHLLAEFRLRAAIGAAKGGHIDTAVKLFEKTAKREEQQEAVIDAAMSHGHMTAVMQHFPCPKGLTLKDDKFLNHPITLKAASLGGHSDTFKSLTPKKPSPILLTTLAERGNLESAASLVDLTKVDYKDIIRRMDSDKYFQSEAVLLYTLTMMQGSSSFIDLLASAALEMRSDEELRHNTSRKASPKVFQRDFFYKFRELNQRAKKIRTTMDRLDLNYDQAKSYIELDVKITPQALVSLVRNKQEHRSSPVLSALLENSGIKFRSAAKEAQFAQAAKILPSLVGALISSNIDEFTKLDDLHFSDEEDLYSDSVIVFNFKLHDLIAKMAFSGFEPKAVARDLSILTGLTERDAGALYEQFCLKVYKSHIEAKLDRYINYNNEASLFTNPFARVWDLAKRPVDMIRTAHSGRAQSILDELEKPSDPNITSHNRASLQGIFSTTKSMFDKKSRPTATEDGPKWQQPLQNVSRDDEFYKIADELSSSRLTK